MHFVFVIISVVIKTHYFIVPCSYHFINTGLMKIASSKSSSSPSSSSSYLLYLSSSSSLSCSSYFSSLLLCFPLLLLPLVLRLFLFLNLLPLLLFSCFFFCFSFCSFFYPSPMKNLHPRNLQDQMVVWVQTPIGRARYYRAEH